MLLYDPKMMKICGICIISSRKETPYAHLQSGIGATTHRFASADLSPQPNHISISYGIDGVTSGEAELDAAG